MRKFGATVLIAAGVLVSSAANAQSWGVYVENAPGYHGYDQRGEDWDNGFRAVCSGQRARSLEAKLSHEAGEDEIDDWDAARIHRQIDRLEQKQDRECR
ncbi:MAG TPA: histidine kinase, partial [Sphingomicrobium sp.]|nr:histidine kinase [Sphingomicrobium sp.]